MLFTPSSRAALVNIVPLQAASITGPYPLHLQISRDIIGHVHSAVHANDCPFFE